MSGKKFLTSVSVNATDDYQAIENASLTVSFGAVLAVLDVLELTHTLRDVARTPETGQQTSSSYTGALFSM